MINNLEEPEFIASVTGKRWTPGRTLRVSFLDGDPMVDKKVKRDSLRMVRPCQHKI
jgi:hypothetical protein